MNIVVASNNSHKILEFRAILIGHTVLAPQDLGINFNHDETGTTFYDNAISKAQALYAMVSKSAAKIGRYSIIADDSGLVVSALDGAPGVYSARYGWQEQRPPTSDQERNELLLSNMQGKIDRFAYYVCSLAVFFGNDNLLCAQETWHGSIAQKQSVSKRGFGYDPLFFLDEFGCTVADLPPGEKEKLSHRAKAARQILKLLSDP